MDDYYIIKKYNEQNSNYYDVLVCILKMKLTHHLILIHSIY